MNRTQVISAAAMLACAGAAFGQCTNPIRLVHQDRVASDFIGGALASDVSGSGIPIVLAGMGSDDTPAGANAGSVRVFLRSGGLWGHQEISDMFAADGQPNDFFGVSVGYDAPRIVIGATGVGDHGAAYFFQHDGSVFWQRTKVLPPIAQSGQDFGRCVALSGDWAVVTAPLFDSDGDASPGFQNPNSGAVFFYKRNADGTWSHMQSRTYDNLFSLFDGQQMGQSAAMNGDVAVVGAPNAERVNWPLNHGYIQVFQRTGNTWNAQDLGGTFWAPGDIQENDHFGTSVSVWGDWIAVGAPDDDATAQQMPSGPKTNSGCVYLYRKTGGQWALHGRVFADDASDNARFGTEVVIHDGKLFVVAGGTEKVYFFEDNGVGTFVQKKVYGDPDGDHSFGTAISFDGETLAIGDQNDSVGVNLGGALYVIEPEARGSDSCAFATEVYAFPQYGCTTHSTLNGSTTCGSATPNGPDVYYKWTARCSGSVIFDTFGSEYDTVLSVHTLCPEPGNSSTIACNDDGFPNISGNRDSLVTFNAVEGTTYRIRVSGWNGAKGNYVLRHWSASPGNNACASATVVTNGAHDFFTCNATLDGSASIPVGAGSVPVGADVWFRYTATCTGTLALNTCGSSFDTVLAVYAGNCPAVNAVPIASNDDTGTGSVCGGSLQSALKAPVVAGQVYTIRIAGFEYSNASGVQSGQGTLSIACMQQGCNAADVATAGSVDPQSGPDGFLTGDDFDLFVNAFFTEMRRDIDNAYIADITDGTGSGGPDGFLTGSDFDKFVQLFFAGC